MKPIIIRSVLGLSMFAFSACTQGGGRGASASSDIGRDLLGAINGAATGSTAINVSEGPYHVCSNCEIDQTEKIVKAISDGVAQSKTVYFPKGTYRVSRTIATVGPGHRLVLKGESRSLTTIQLTAAIGDRGLIEAVGGPAPGAPEKRNHARVEVSDISFDARAGAFDQPGFSADCFRLSDVVLAKFESVVIQHFDGAAIRGYGWWDSVMTDVHFIRSGSAGKRTAAVELGSRDNDTFSGATNNISFTNCRWEANRYLSLRLMEGARKIHVLASKFHGMLPEAAPFDHVDVVDSNSNTFSQNNFTNGGGTSLRFMRSFGNNVTGNTIGGQPGYAIYLRQSPRNVIMGNNLNTESSSAGIGDIFWDTNPGSTFLGNAGRRTCVLASDTMTCGPTQASSESLLDSIVR